MSENMDNQTTFFEYVYDKFIINDKDNHNNIEKTYIYNNFLNFIDYLMINDINLHSKFINLRNYFISKLSVKKEVPIIKDFYPNDKNKKINFIFQSSFGFKMTLPTPLDVTFSKLIQNFENAFRSRVSIFNSSSKFTFYNNATRLNIEDKRSVKDIFKLEFNKDNILITVFDGSLIAA